jgi:hypothetical protein
MLQRYRLVAAAFALAAAACANPARRAPSDMDIDFVRGCWVQKSAPGETTEAFLRLLPDGDALGGQIADVSTGDWITVATFSFARAGDRVSFDARDMPEQLPHARIDPSRLGASFDWARASRGGKLAAFAGPAPSRNFLFVESGNDRLAVWAVSAEPDATLVFTLFDGERDGCD